MIHFFTDPYEEELLYSAIARYHYYTGNIDFKDTLEELFNKRTIVASFELGSNIEALAKNIGGKYTADYIIKKHTIFPFYSPFLPKRRREILLRDIKLAGGNKLYTRLGMVAGGVCRKSEIYYCPNCAAEEIKVYGEAYIHREPQLQGIYLCPKHGVILKPYLIRRKACSKLEYIKFKPELLKLEPSQEVEASAYEKLLKLSKAAYFLLKEDLTSISKEKIAKAYKNLLYEIGLTTSSGRIKQRELYEEFVSFYGEKFLQTMESSLVYEDEFNWLKVATRNTARTVHPIRHLLLINFLCKDIADFFKNINCKYRPFGKGPWPCLNKVAEHYRERVVTRLEITEDYKTRVPVGTFTCSCGFIYSRKGPDKLEQDKYRIGRIKSFGVVWEKKLKKLLNEKTKGVKEISRLMGCDAKTVIKYADKLSLNSYANTKSSGEDKRLNKNEKLGLNIEEKYKKDIVSYIENNENCNRKQLREALKKQYIFLYRHEKAWLMENLPEVIPRGKRNNPKDKIDWNKRDEELLALIRKQKDTMLNSKTAIRLTRTSIGKALGILAALEKNINKLPKTEAYLKEIIETVEEFQLRRCKAIIAERLRQEMPIRLWSIQREAGIRTKAFNKLKEELENYINLGEKYEENKSKNY